VVLLTADKSEEARRQALAAGVNAFVHKPVSDARLLSAVDAVLSTGARA
jgi:CheY-like chemotaxis protein